MAHDPDNLRNYFVPDRELTPGHYLFRADLDDLVAGPFEDVDPERLAEAVRLAGRGMNEHQQAKLGRMARSAVYGTGEVKQ